MIEINKVTDVMNHIDGLKAVIFDLDDTLYSEKEYIKSGYHEVAKLLPMIPSAEEKLWSAFEHHQYAIDTVLNGANVYSEDLKHKCLNAYRFQAHPDIYLYDGVEDMLSELKKQSLKIGIITDGRPEGQHAKILDLGLQNKVDEIIITDELGGVKYRKPCEKAFVSMHEKLNVPYEKMAYVGDNISKDFIAPENLGMRSIWFRNRDGLYI